MLRFAFDVNELIFVTCLNNEYYYYGTIQGMADTCTSNRHDAVLLTVFNVSPSYTATIIIYLHTSAYLL